MHTISNETLLEPAGAARGQGGEDSRDAAFKKAGAGNYSRPHINFNINHFYLQIGDDIQRSWERPAR